MAIQQELIDAIDKALAAGIPVNYKTASAANDVFEGYVWSLVISAAKSAGANVAYKDVSNNDAAQLVFRTSPGHIYSEAKLYTHALLEFPDCPLLEVHLGVYVSGKSGVIHECDVAVIDHLEAMVCRKQRVHPRSSKVPIALECKFYTGTLQLGLARAFLGFTEELTKPDRYLVTNASSPNAAKMIVYHKADLEFDLNLKVTDQAASLRARLQRTFRNYGIKHKKA